MFDSFERRKRPHISKAEWEVIKSTARYRCVICAKHEREVGQLQKSHIKAHGRGGNNVVPMCANCHGKYHREELTEAQLRKIGLTPQQHRRLVPKVGSAKADTRSSRPQARDDMRGEIKALEKMVYDSFEGYTRRKQAIRQLGKFGAKTALSRIARSRDVENSLQEEARDQLDKLR